MHGNYQIDLENNDSVGGFFSKIDVNYFMHFRQEQELTIFCGGMPRSSYGDRFTVSASRGTGQQHVVYDFSSKVIDFLTIDASYDGDGNILFCV
jgi:hypothetical protein